MGISNLKCSIGSKAVRTIALIAGLSLLTACASVSNRKAFASDCHGEIEKEDRIKLDLIADELQRENYYSVLAKLEQAPNYARVLKMRADAMRKTGDLRNAYDTYRDLSLTCMGAYGHAGMAKVLAEQGDLDLAHQQMQKARRLQPTNPDIRNDYGFVLLATGDYQAAQREFMTTIQLQPGNQLARRNMVMSLILNGDQKEAIDLAKKSGISPSDFQDLVRQARHFKTNSKARKASASHPNTLEGI